MATIIEKPAVVAAAGTKPKRIEEFFGRVNSGSDGVSIARMKSPAGWSEPAQQPEFDEYTVVLAGVLHLKLEDREYDLTEGQAVLVGKGERVEYSTPRAGGAEYISVCMPAFSPETVHREES